MGIRKNTVYPWLRTSSSLVSEWTYSNILTNSVNVLLQWCWRLCDAENGSPQLVLIDETLELKDHIRYLNVFGFKGYNKVSCSAAEIHVYGVCLFLVDTRLVQGRTNKIDCTANHRVWLPYTIINYIIW